MPKDAGDEEKTEGTHVFLVLWKTYRALLAQSDASIEQTGLCDSDFRVLEILLHKGPLPVNVIGHKVELTTGSITTAVDRLQEKNLVVRTHSPTDRRVRIVALTAPGRRLIEKTYTQHRAQMNAAVQGLSCQERSTLVDLLKRLGQAAAEAHEPKTT